MSCFLLLDHLCLSQHLRLLLLLLHPDLVPGNLRYQLDRGRCALERLEKQRVCLQCLVEQEFLCAVRVEQLSGISHLHCGHKIRGRLTTSVFDCQLWLILLICILFVSF